MLSHAALLQPVSNVSKFGSNRGLPFLTHRGVTHMLTDIKLRALRPRDGLYRVADRDGLAIEVPVTLSLPVRRQGQDAEPGDISRHFTCAGTAAP